MMTDGEEGRSRSGLGTVGESRDFTPNSLPREFARQLRRRWKMLGAIVVTAITTGAIYWVDEELTKDAWVFALLTAVLLLYTLLTIRSDLKLE